MLNSSKYAGYSRHTTLKEDVNGDLVITFTSEELKILGVRPGQMVDFGMENSGNKIKNLRIPKAGLFAESRLELKLIADGGDQALINTAPSLTDNRALVILLVDLPRGDAPKPLFSNHKLPRPLVHKMDAPKAAAA